jgi:hypothetical protein
VFIVQIHPSYFSQTHCYFISASRRLIFNLHFLLQNYTPLLKCSRLYCTVSHINQLLYPNPTYLIISHFFSIQIFLIHYVLSDSLRSSILSFQLFQITSNPFLVNPYTYSHQLITILTITLIAFTSLIYLFLSSNHSRHTHYRSFHLSYYVFNTIHVHTLTIRFIT